MKKIPNIYERDESGKLLIGQWRDDTLWVKQDRDLWRATRKWDGTACLVRDNVLYKRYDRKLIKDAQKYKDAPLGWEACQDPDPVTGHWPGWVPVGDEPESKWHRDAWTRGMYADGTWELCGPKVQGNPEGFEVHTLVPHGTEEVEFLDDDDELADATLEVLIYTTLADRKVEGIVFHHRDGRMAKIRRADYGFAWPVR